MEQVEGRVGNPLLCTLEFRPLGISPRPTRAAIPDRAKQRIFVLALKPFRSIFYLILRR